ncbi:MAG: LCP family protein [Oscillospiraceae bacterium]|nr:LCP family protein [Oscillospiraceae bacterium]
MKKRNSVRKLTYFCIILILALIMVYSGLRILESTVFYHGEEQKGVTAGKTITKDGVKYFPRQDITVVMLMGIDQPGPAEDSGSYNNPGLADVVMLAIFDEKEEQCSLLTINRDTMVEMPVLGLGGKQAGTDYAQLALAHTYGSGLEDSCENTRDTVSAFLGGVNIDYYISMRVDAVAMLNDAVGGVTVNVEEDFSEADISLPKGTVTLRGDQARAFVQSRQNVGDELNLSRIERQKQYMNGFADAFRESAKSGDSSFVLDTYNEIAPYLVSDLPVSNLTSMVERYIDYPLSRIISLEGENRLGEEFYEFYADEEKLEELRLNLFYAPK